MYPENTYNYYILFGRSLNSPTSAAHSLCIREISSFYLPQIDFN